MITKFLIACVACCGLSAQALPIVFSNSQYETSAVAIAGSQADTNFDSSPPSALPLVTSATVVGATDFASGNGIAAGGLLQTLAEASSGAGLASAVGTSEFIGTFTGGGPFGIRLDFNSQNFTDTGAFSSGNLFLLLISNNITLANEVFSAPSIITRTYNLPFGSVNSLDLLLSSEASTTTGGNAFNLASVGIQATSLPVAPTWLLMLPGLLCLVPWSRRAPRWA